MFGISIIDLVVIAVYFAVVIAIGVWSMRLTVQKEGQAAIYLPWQMIFYLAGGTIAGIVVSLFTKPVATEKLDNFYALIRTPIAPGEQISASCTLPADAVVPPKRVLLPKTNIEIMTPSRTSVLGFLVGWGCVGIIIYAVFLITRV